MFVLFKNQNKKKTHFSSYRAWFIDNYRKIIIALEAGSANQKDMLNKLHIKLTTVSSPAL